MFKLCFFFIFSWWREWLNKFYLYEDDRNKKDNYLNDVDIVLQAEGLQ